MPLCPCFVLRPHCGGERRGLIALDMGNVGLNFLLHLVDGLTQVRQGTTRTEFGIAVPHDLTARDHRAQPVARQPDTMGENRTGRARVGQVLRPLVQALIAQLFGDGEHAVKRGRHIGHKLLRGDRHTLPPPLRPPRETRSVCQPTGSRGSGDGQHAPPIHAAERRVARIHGVNSWSSASAHSSRRCSAPSYRTSCFGSCAQWYICTPQEEGNLVSALPCTTSSGRGASCPASCAP